MKTNMNTKFLNLLINWNGGIERGAKIKLAKALEISHTKISDWIGNRQKPGEININKMSAILNVPVEELKAIFGIKERAIGPGLILLPRQDYPISAVAHAGEVVFIDTKPLLREEKIMKIFIKIADNGFLPYFQEGDIVEVETNIALKEKGICLCRDVGGKTYFLRKDTGFYPFLPGGKEAKKTVVNTVIIGWAVRVIHIKEL